MIFRAAQAFFLLFVLSLSGCHPRPSSRQVCFKNHCVDVEIASKQADRERGLQFRDSLGEKKGMLFVFSEEQRHGFWMKDTKISLDIIWLDSSQRVVHVERNVPPCRQDPCAAYIPEEASRYVLEINAGHSQRMGFKEGDRLEFHFSPAEGR